MFKFHYNRRDVQITFGPLLYITLIAYGSDELWNKDIYM